VVAASGNPLRCALRHGLGHVFPDDLKKKMPEGQVVLRFVSGTAEAVPFHLNQLEIDDAVR